MYEVQAGDNTLVRRRLLLGDSEGMGLQSGVGLGGGMIFFLSVQLLTSSQTRWSLKIQKMNWEMVWKIAAAMMRMKKRKETQSALL